MTVHFGLHYTVKSKISDNFKTFVGNNGGRSPFALDLDPAFWLANAIMSRGSYLYSSFLSVNPAPVTAYSWCKRLMKEILFEGQILRENSCSFLYHIYYKSYKIYEMSCNKFCIFWKRKYWGTKGDTCPLLHLNSLNIFLPSFLIFLDAAILFVYVTIRPVYLLPNRSRDLIGLDATV